MTFEKEKLVFEKEGYFLFKNFFSESEISSLENAIRKPHSEWLKLHSHKDTVNSNYLTSSSLASDRNDRLTLFHFISQNKIFHILKSLFPEEKIFFLNTQVFFTPENQNRLPYWHRDVQYLGVDEEEQIRILQKDIVLHFRIPLISDPGIELIPGSHSRWDTEEEKNVRLELKDAKNSNSLPNSVLIPHERKDLLVFSAHLIHRGNYSQKRMSLDILYTNFPEKENTIKTFSHFPNEEELKQLDHGEIYHYAQNES